MEAGEARWPDRQIWRHKDILTMDQHRGGGGGLGAVLPEYIHAILGQKEALHCPPLSLFTVLM